MKIGINASWMTPGSAGGMEWYLRWLIDQLAVVDENNEYLLVTGPMNHHTFQARSSRWRTVLYSGAESDPQVYRRRPPSAPVRPRWKRALGACVPIGRRGAGLAERSGPHAWHESLASLLHAEAVDVWFCPFMYALPLDAGVPIVHTIPDLQHEHHPEFFSEAERAVRALGYQTSCQAATATMGISRFVADDLVERYHLEPERVFAIPLGVDPGLELAVPRLDELAAAVRQKYRLERPFAFYPANGWPHKNHERLVRAMQLVVQRRPDLELVLIGCPFELQERFPILLNERGLEKQVRHLGYVERQEVLGLYAACTMLVFPSLFEGFGLPIVEAMRLGVPICCSHVGSLPEVGGNAVRYFDPHSEDAIAEAIVELATDEARRRHLVAVGRAHATRYSYRETARQTLKVFEAVHAGRWQPLQRLFHQPLDAHGFLQRQEGRWYFRVPGLREIRLTVRQPGRFLRGSQRIEICCNGQRLLAARIHAGTVQTAAAPVKSDAGVFHMVELRTWPEKGTRAAAVQVMHLDAIDANGQALRLA